MKILMSLLPVLIPIALILVAKLLWRGKRSKRSVVKEIEQLVKKFHRILGERFNQDEISYMRYSEAVKTALVSLHAAEESASYEKDCLTLIRALKDLIAEVEKIPKKGDMGFSVEECIEEMDRLRAAAKAFTRP